MSPTEPRDGQAVDERPAADPDRVAHPVEAPVAERTPTQPTTMAVDRATASVIDQAHDIAFGATPTTSEDKTGDLEARITALEHRLSQLSAEAESSRRLEALEQELAVATDRARTLEQRVETRQAQDRTRLSRRVDQLHNATREAAKRLRRELREDIGRTRSRLAIPDSELVALEAYRASAEYARIFESPEPLVSVVVATYDRARVLTERSLPSLLEQDYTNLEIIVVSDGSTDDTEERVRALGDPRIRFAEVAERTVPAVIGRGTDAQNLGRSLATGDLLTHLDDDDESAPDRMGRLVRFMQARRIELVWHPFWWQESAEAEWTVNDAMAFAQGQVTNGSAMYLRWFGRVRMDAWARRYRDAGDWLLLRTIRDAGVKAERYPLPLMRHYLEKQNPRMKEVAGAGTDWTNLGALRQRVSLIPELNTEADYAAAVEDPASWQRAIREVGMRTGFDSRGVVSPDRGSRYPTMSTAHGGVITFYGPYRDGRSTFGTVVRSLESAGQASGSLVPRLFASGRLTDDWSFTVTTPMPGERLSSVRDDLSAEQLNAVAGWLANTVDTLHGAPMTADERNDGWDALMSTVGARYASIEQTLADRATLPPHVTAAVSAWLPRISELLPDDGVAVRVHGRLDDDIIRGIRLGDRFDPTGLTDAGLARVGHPYQEFGALLSNVVRGQTGLLRAFLRASKMPGLDDADFPRLALAHVLIDETDHLASSRHAREAGSLDELADRLFGEARERLA